MARLKLHTFAWKIFPGNYAYVTARVKAKKPQLLPKEAYARLLAMDVHEIARFLQEGRYRKEVDELAGRYSGARLVEMATRLNLARTYVQIRGFCTGELEKMVQLFLQRYDVYNIKTILRGKFARLPSEEILEQLVPAGALGTEELEGLTRLGSLDDVVERLSDTLYGPVLKESLQKDSSNLAELENEVEKRYYAALVHTVDASIEPNRAFLGFLKREIDLLNLKTALRLRVDEVDAPELFVAGGSEVHEERFKRWLRAGSDEIASDVGALSFGRGLGELVKRGLERRELNAIIAVLDKALIQGASGFSSRYPLSVLPVVDYLLRKRRETDNLRIIALGKRAGLPPETIKELVNA